MIDIRYWAYTADGGLYAPNGGQNLAPRQHLRQTRQKPGGAAAIVKAVREYRTRYPDKAVTLQRRRKLPQQPRRLGRAHRRRLAADVKLPAELASVIPTLRPTDGIVSGAGQWCLGRDRRRLSDLRRTRRRRDRR